MADVDGGIKTFLIADVRGYTRFTQQRGDEAAAELTTLFAEIARDRVEANGGRVIEFRGDEALAVFDSARAAIRAAIELQEHLIAHTVADPSRPLAVGIGLDAGEAVRVADGYRGGALNLAARLCSMAAPGEVLATREVTHLARHVEGVAYHANGSARLKGLAEPVPVIAVKPTAEDASRLVTFRRVVGGGAVATAVDARNPYKGLRAFEEDDADDFFGREALSEHLVDRLAATRFLAVVGPSGSGKSSVVRAGLVPALRRGALEGSERWPIVQMFPGAYPLEELEAVLLRVADAPPASLIELLEEGERGLVRALKRVLPDDGTELVLVVDQLEEVFTLVADEARRAHFLALLERAVADPKSRLRVVTTLRADFYDRPLLYSGFAELLRDYVEALVPLTPEEFERAISRPAERAGATFEAGLLSEMVTDVANEPGALPLLQYALTQLYDRRDGTVLTRDAYHAIGGVSGALAGRAEEIYDELSEPAQEAARQLFLRLVTLGEGSEDTRRRVERTELDATEIDGDALNAAIDGFGSSRLLSFDRDPRSGQPTVEVAHEALLREWLRLRRWIDSAREDLRLHRRLAASAREWAEAANERSFLLRGGQLAQFDALADESRIALTDLEREFLAASRAAGQAELQRQQRENRRLRALLLVAAALLVVSIAARVVALLQRSSARHEATVALARELGAKAVVEPRLDRAMLLADEAVDLDDSRDTEGTLLSTLLRSPAAISTFSSPITDRPQTVTLSPDGHTLVVVENSNLVRFYDTRTRREKRPPLRNAVHLPAAFSADGRYLLVVRRTGSDSSMPAVEIRDGRTFRHVRFLPIDRLWETASEDFAQILLVSPDDARAYLVYGLVDPRLGADLQTRVDAWDIRTGKLLRRKAVGTKGVFDARFDRRGRLRILADDVVATLDPVSLRIVAERRARFPGPSSFDNGALSPDGRSAAFSQPSGAVSFVDLGSGRATAATGKTGVAVQAIGYSPDGRALLTTDENGVVTVWDPATASVRETFSGHEDRAPGMAFTPDGRTVYTCSLDGAIFAWDLGGTRRFGRPFSAAASSIDNYDAPPLPPLALSGDGSQFALRLQPLRIGIYSLPSLRQQRTFAVAPGQNDLITSIAWSPSRKELAVAQTNDRVELWSVAGRPHLERTLGGLPRPTKALGVSVGMVGFSPDGSLVAVVGRKHTPGSTPPLGFAAVWRTRDGALVWKERRPEGPGDVLAFSHDGRRLALVFERYFTAEGFVQIVDSTTGRRERTISPLGQSTSVAFAPNGTLATGSWQGIVQLWKASSAKEIGHPMLAMPAPVASIAFTPPGDEFATGGGSGGFVKLWDTRTQQQVGTALPGSPGRWANALFTPDGRRLLTLYDDGRGAVWPMSLAAWKAQACRVAGRDLTREEWTRFVTGRSYSKICT